MFRYEVRVPALMFDVRRSTFDVRRSTRPYRIKGLLSLLRSLKGAAASAATMSSIIYDRLNERTSASRLTSTSMGGNRPFGLLIDLGCQKKLRWQSRLDWPASRRVYPGGRPQERWTFAQVRRNALSNGSCQGPAVSRRDSFGNRVIEQASRRDKPGGSRASPAKFAVLVFLFPAGVRKNVQPPARTTHHICGCRIGPSFPSEAWERGHGTRA